MEMDTTKSAKQVYKGANKVMDQFVEKLQAGAEEVAKKATGLESTLSSKYTGIKESAVENYDAAIDTVKKHPVYTVLGSAALGMVAGIFWARKNSNAEGPH